MADTATITAVTGPAITVTAGVFHNVTNIAFDTVDNTLRIACDEGIVYFSLTGSNTITLTTSSGSYTLTVS